MVSVAGLLLALVCLAIVAAGLGLAAAAWRPGLRLLATVTAIVPGLVGAASIVAAAVHQLAAALP